MDKSAEREFTEFVESRGVALLRLAFALTGEQHAAEDLVQTALAKAMLRWSRIRGDAEPYLRRTMYNEHVSWWRRRWRRAELSTAELPDRGAVEDDDPHLRLAVRQALAGLPPRQRAVLVLRYLEDLSERQVADMLGISTGTVGSQASRALATLRRRMEEQDSRRSDPERPGEPKPPARPPGLPREANPQERNTTRHGAAERDGTGVHR